MAASAGKSITIVGAGIAGICAALCLKKHAIDVTIIEKRSDITATGAGIQITPNAFRVLDALGLGERIRIASHGVHHLSILKGRSNKLITHMPLGAEFERTHNAPYLVLKRQALLDVLYQQAMAQGIPIQFNTQYLPSNENNEGIIIGADGVWSLVREQVNGLEARFAGRSAFRCMIPAHKAPQATAPHDLTMWLGKNAHFVSYPVDAAGSLNLVCVVKNQRPDKRWAQPATCGEIVQHLKGWNNEIIALIEQGENWQRWPLYTLSPSQSWSHNNKVLIGDAAHAMLPFLAQGGAMAIEDAATLAHAIATTSDMPQAFANYQLLRQKRVTDVWKEANANAQRYHWSGMMAEMRDLGLKAMGGQRLQQRYHWIYDWKPAFL